MNVKKSDVGKLNVKKVIADSARPLTKSKWTAHEHIALLERFKLNTSTKAPAKSIDVDVSTYRVAMPDRRQLYREIH